jgi:hypothetical protein
VGHISKICTNNKKNINLVQGVDEKSEQNDENFKSSDVFYVEKYDNNKKIKKDKRLLNQCNGKKGKVVEANFVNTVDKNPFKINVKIKNRVLPMLIDTGSSVSALSYETYCQNFSNCRLEQDETALRVYDGTMVSPKGFIVADVTYRNVSKLVRFYIVDNNSPGLLGRDWINSFNVKIEMVNMVSAESRVNRLINKYKNLFDNKLGRYKYLNVSIELEKDAKPIYCKYRNVPLAYKDKIENELINLEREGVIVPVESSAWATPLVPILKEGGQIRLCGDYKTTINRCIKDFKYPLPRIEEIFAKLNKGILFSKIDLVKAYNQFAVDEKTSEILTWNTSRGLYRVLRLPFGIKTASSIFQKSVESLFQGMSGVVNFLDDILVTGKDDEEHLSNLEKVFDILQNAGLTVNKEKCEFFKAEIEYLGHKISKQGIRKSDDKIKAITEAPEPTNITEVRSFLGLVNYYHKFIPSAAEILNPIYALLKNENKFVWNKNCSDSFRKVKEIIAADICLAHFNPDLPIYLTTDASNTGISGVLSHIIDGKEQIIACTSRTLMPAETKYSTVQKEALSIRHSVGKFYQYLIGNFFILRTDHKPLVALFGENKGLPQMAANRLQRWALFLSEFDYKIEHIKGKDNPVADFMSRMPRKLNTISEEYSEKGLYINFAETVKEWPIDNEEVRKQSSIDKEIKVVMEFVKKDQWPNKIEENLKPYYNIRENLTAEKGILMWGHRIVIPKILRKTLLQELHAGHFGMNRTKTLARSVLYWPSIDKDIENMIKSCMPCLKNKQDPPKNEAVAWPKSEFVFERVHCDFLYIRNNTILVLCDSYSKWLEVMPVKGTTEIETEDKLREIFARMGLPKTLVSDNGPPFSSRNFKNFLSMNGIKHVTSPPYHPQSNGAAENAVKTFKNKISTALIDPQNRGISLQTLISRYLLTYRNTKHTVTGRSPAEIVFNRPLRTRLTLLKEQKEERNEVMTDKTRRKFKNGEVVMIRCYKNGKKSWEKAMVEKRIGKTTYICRYPSGITCKRHANQIMIIGFSEKSNEQCIRDFNTNNNYFNSLLTYQSIANPIFCPSISLLGQSSEPEQSRADMSSTSGEKTSREETNGQLQSEPVPPYTANVEDETVIRVNRDKNYKAYICSNVIKESTSQVVSKCDKTSKHLNCKNKVSEDKIVDDRENILKVSRTNETKIGEKLIRQECSRDLNIAVGNKNNNKIDINSRPKRAIRTPNRLKD